MPDATPAAMTAAPLDPEFIEALRPVERELVERRPEVEWLHPLRLTRLGNHWKGTGYMRRLQCRFCLALDGTPHSYDEGRIGYLSESQFNEHLQREHQR